MSFAFETNFTFASVTGNVASTVFSPVFVGGGAELLAVFGAIDVSNGCTGGHVGSHANLTAPTNYTSTATNGITLFFSMAIWSGGAGSASLSAVYDGGNSGTNGGKICWAVLTGYKSNIQSSPGQSQFATATSGTASATFASGINPGDLVVAIQDNSGNVTFTAGSGYTSSGTTSVWFTNHRTATIWTTSLSEPGPSATPSSTLTSNTWTMLAIQLPVQPAAPQNSTLLYSQRKVLYFI